MNNIDELINEIRSHEVVEIENGLSKAERERIEKRVLADIVGEGSNIRKKKRPKRWFVLALAAVLILGMGISAYAAREKEWDIALINFMGLSGADTLQLENGMVEIKRGQKSLCVDYGSVETGEEKEIEMQAVSSIGDKNEVYVRIETDYVLPEDFNPETDYILPDDYSLSVSSNKSGYGSTFTYFAEDNRLGFLMGISNCQNVNTAEISVALKDLYLYHDLQGDSGAEKELLCEGSWELNWTYHYESHTETHHMFRTIEADGITYYITKVEVSPLSVRVEAFRMPWNRTKEYVDLKVEEIHFKDGTVMEVADFSESGVKNGMWFETYVGAEELGQVLDPKQVSALVMEGTEITFLY